MHVLLIDDDEIGVLVRGELLRTEGHTTVEALTGRDGIKSAMAENFSVIVLDLNLPDMSGLDVLRSIRELKPNQPIIVLTGSMRIPDEMLAQASVLLTKGCGALAVINAINRYGVAVNPAQDIMAEETRGHCVFDMIRAALM